MSGNLIIIRGIPGSGKSTLAKTIMHDSVDDFEHFEADMFHINEDGEYNFNPSNLKSAHNWCKHQVKTSLLQDKNVIVSNTFIKMWEMKPYLDMDCASLAIFECDGGYESIHGVPSDKIDQMKNNWEELPSCFNNNKGALK